jgi:glycerophosphoryl diester phosphodiesterase
LKIREQKKKKNTTILVSSFDWMRCSKWHLNDKIGIGVLTETDLNLALAFLKT